VNKGCIFDIQSYAVHDGPGIRTLVFFKGCPLRCVWCANSEGLNPNPELTYTLTHCKLSLNCVKACPSSAITPTKTKIEINRNLCGKCQVHPCIQACFNGALKVAGSWMGVGELLERVERDRPFWRSEGGVTISGGEPLYQPDFLLTFLRECHDRGISCMMETCCHGNTDRVRRIVDYLDFIFCDLKVMDGEKHRLLTGVKNELILKNIRLLASTERCVIRVPIVPGYTDSSKNIEDIATFLAEIRGDVMGVNLLPFHRLGAGKYEMLGLDYLCRSLEAPSDEKLKQIKEIFEAHGVKCWIGSEMPW
jgi:pyruvate formate lyase activating enzyme